ncbi:glycerate-2-kinase family protein [Deinococcus maricopensis]|uniref:glycerate-2-kinase family protein n=1 Tax=Deinococcus maricopensis TaxID=309887 RepID=UPI0002E6132C|nr:glycerate-2-kinase family protein [Deinococcus maricopensis]
MPPRAALLAALNAGVRAAAPSDALARHLPPRPRGRVLALALGKASVPMARALHAAWGAPDAGLIITPHGTGAAIPGFRVMEAAHPVPDAHSEAAGGAALRLAAHAGAGETLVVLLSGGGSALACAPLGVTLAEKAETTRALLACGAGIHDVNTVRRHLSALKGGGVLRAAHPQARVVTYALSDVVGDDPATIAGGPTVPPPTAPGDALTVLDRYGLALPRARGAARPRGAAPPQPERRVPRDRQWPPRTRRRRARPRGRRVRRARLA